MDARRGDLAAGEWQRRDDSGVAFEVLARVSGVVGLTQGIASLSESAVLEVPPRFGDAAVWAGVGFVDWRGEVSMRCLILGLTPFRDGSSLRECLGRNAQSVLVACDARLPSGG